MGIYLNSKTAYTLYKNEMKKPYFVDKSWMLKELFPLVEEGTNYICITRPRQFGKTVTANMVAAFFSSATDASGLFDSLEIAQDERYPIYRNQFQVIHISFNDIMGPCDSYAEYIGQIEAQLARDLKSSYPDVELYHESVIHTLINIYAADDTARFIFVLDEWDFIFHQSFATQEDKKQYLLFLRSLLKDRPYVLLAYMTGILPIAKYSSGSELNMFAEFTMVSSPEFSDSFGFTETETAQLYQRYLKNCKHPHITPEGLRYWYNGYHTACGERVYNPRSVVQALRYNNLANYWTSSGPYDEIYYYIENNVAEVREDLMLMVSGTAVSVKLLEYAATAMILETKEEIFSAMVVYGFLSYANGKVFIPNKELMDKFADMLRKEPSLGYVYRLAKASGRMLQATIAGDTQTMTEILTLAHDTEVPILSYNSEAELAAIVNLVYLSARDTYRIEREEKAGKGYVDFIFYPESDKSDACLILELKIDSTPDEAIQQIKEKRYALRFQKKLGDTEKYTGKKLAVGISYNRKSKEHFCKVEIL